MAKQPAKGRKTPTKPGKPADQAVFTLVLEEQIILYPELPKLILTKHETTSKIIFLKNKLKLMNLLTSGNKPILLERINNRIGLITSAFCVKKTSLLSSVFTDNNT